MPPWCTKQADAGEKIKHPPFVYRISHSKKAAMKEFALLFRYSNSDLSQVSPTDIQAVFKKWQEWAAGLAAQGSLVSTGSRLATEGKVLKPGGVITDGPFVEIRERLGGFMVVKADSLEEATTLAHGCPVLDVGGSVEIRAIVS
jgi:hypothetical protein